MILGDNTKLKDLGFEISQSIDDILKEMFEFWIKYYKSKIISSSVLLNFSGESSIT